MSSATEEEEETPNKSVPHNIQTATTTLALEILSNDDFKSEKYKKQELIHINVKVVDNIDEQLNKACFAHFFDALSPVLITFKSEKEIKIFWKIADNEKFYHLEICDSFCNAAYDFCKQFLIAEIIGNKNGILLKSQEKKNLNLQDVGNENGQNLLMHAAVNNQDDVIEELLKHDFDVDDEDVNGHNAIEKAWISCMNTSNLEIKDKYFKIILSLLKNNSKYPKKFDLRYVSLALKKFVEYSENLHSLIDESKLEELKLELENETQLCYFYDRTNKSLMAHAMESNEFNIWKLLISLKLSTGYHEIQNLGRFYKSYDHDMKEEIRAEHQNYARELPSSHVHYLLTCSRIGNNDRRSDERWTLVEEAFRIMDTDKSCSKILKIAAKWKRLTIYFDFKHDTAYYLDPVAQLSTKGVIYGARTIYIGAKYLSDEKMKHEVISYIIHELCHLAVFLAYINYFDPYPNGESEDKRRFEDEVVPECKNNGQFEEIVGGVTKYYIKKHHNSEYIVRVVQMLMHYYVQDPSIECDNSKILKDRREKFEKLFKYYEEVVEKDFDNFLGIIDTLLDDSKDISYYQLTGPMKARILHSKVNFQGQQTTLNEIIGNNEEVLSRLTSKQIRNMLIDGKRIEIGHSNTITTKLSAIERQFTIPYSYDYKSISQIQNEVEISKLSILSDSAGAGKTTYDYKSISQIQNEVEISKLFILSDSAGAGKTTTFEKLTVSLKESNKNVWVCFIKLRAHRSCFDSYDSCTKLSLDDVLQLLINVQVPNEVTVMNKLETEIFKYLFKNDKIIMLLDGVDEISPDYNNFIVKMLTVLKEKTKNQVWISSRPQCATILEDSLNIKAHKLKPYTIKEREIFTSEIYDNFYKSNKTADSEPKTVTINNLKVFYEILKNNGYSDFYNPLMIKMITELYIQRKIDINPESANLYNIFDKVTEKLRKELRQKVESEDDNSFNTTFNLGHVHQVLVLKTLFAYDDIKNLSLMTTWKEERSNWSVDRIQRFGFVTLDSRFDKDPRKYYIDFIHRTYADFFAAQFIISIVFDPKLKQFKNSDDFKILFQLINKINISGDSSISKFLLSYMQSNKNRKIKGNENIKWFCELFKKCITVRGYLTNDKDYDVHDCASMKFILVLLSNNSKVFESIWKLRESQNFLEYTLFDTKVNVQEICEMLHISFGLNWDEKFSKAEKKFKFEISNENVKCNIRHGLNLIEFVENNFSILKRSLIYENLDIITPIYNMSKTLREKCLTSIFARFVEISNEDEENAFLKIMEEWSCYCSVEVLEFWKSHFDNLLENCNKKDENFIRKFKHQIILKVIGSFTIRSNRVNEKIIEKLKLPKTIWIKNSEEYKIKLSNILARYKYCISTFFASPTEEFEVLKNILIEIIKPNYNAFFDKFSFCNADDVIIHKKKFNRLKKLLSEFNDLEVKVAFIRKICCSDFEGKLFKNSMKTSKDCFIRVVDLLLFDKNNYGNIQNHLFSISSFSTTIISIILSNMSAEIYPEFMKFLNKLFENNRNDLIKRVYTTRIFKPIESQEKFAIFVKFLNEVFGQNHQKTDMCIKLNLTSYFSESSFNFNSSTNPSSITRTVEIFTIYGHYSKDSYIELFKHLRNKRIFLEIISELSKESCDNFISICSKIFSRYKPHPSEDCLRCDSDTALKFFKDKEKMENLENFLNRIYNDNVESIKHVKRNLVYENFRYLLENASKDSKFFKNLNKFINENNCSIEKLRAIFIAEKITFAIYNFTPVENRDQITQFIGKIFASDMEQIVKSIDLYYYITRINFHDLKKYEKFQDFEDFLLKIVGRDNQHLVDKCFIKIFGHVFADMKMSIEEEDYGNKSCDCINKYTIEVVNELFETFLCKHHELILSIFYYEDSSKIRILKKLIEIFKNHWEWAQDLFLDKFPFDSIQRMSSETYDVFEDFLKLVFKSNMQKFSNEIQKKYSNDEILNNENENCLKFVKTFIETNENN